MDASDLTVGRERPRPRLRGTLFPRDLFVCGGQQRAARAQVRTAEVCSDAAVFGDQLVTGSLFPTALSLNLVFIGGCVLAALAMISALIVYKSKMSTVRYQPLPTQEVDTVQ